MLSKIKKELLFAGVIKKSNEKVRKDILEDNRKAAIFWATIQLIFWSFSLFMSRRQCSRFSVSGRTATHKRFLEPEVAANG